MCSIIGASGIGTIEPKLVKTLYMIAEERGGHGCGYTDGVIVDKDTSKANEYIVSRFSEPVPEFIGHTRYKTVGVSHKDNNHPFQFTNVVGVHNGTIYNKAELEKEYNTSFEVDSQMLYWMINKFGLKRTLPKLVGKVAVAFWDKEKILTLYRFDRPLSIGYKDGMLFYASLGRYLKAIGCTKIKEIPEHTIYRIKEGKIISSKQLPEHIRPLTQEEWKYSKTTTQSETIPLGSFAYRWFDLLPEPYNEKAKTNIITIYASENKRCNNLLEALMSFPWGISPEGENYWKDVYDKVKNGEFVKRPSVFMQIEDTTIRLKLYNEIQKQNKNVSQLKNPLDLIFALDWDKTEDGQAYWTDVWQKFYHEKEEDVEVQLNVSGIVSNYRRPGCTEKYVAASENAFTFIDQDGFEGKWWFSHDNYKELNIEKEYDDSYFFYVLTDATACEDLASDFPSILDDVNLILKKL